MFEQTIFITELNSHITYRLTSQEKYIVDIGVVKVYGILAFKEGKEHSSNRQFCVNIRDISGNPKFVEHILESLILHNVLPIHIIEIIEDLL